MISLARYFLFISIIFATNYHYSQEISLKEQKKQQEQTNLTLPEVPESQTNQQNSKNTSDEIDPLDIDSEEVVSKEKTLPNDGSAYFTISTGLAPYQAGIGILKYFIPELWGQLELNVTFLPSVPVIDYYLSIDFFQTYVAFRVILGYSFYRYRIFEISLLAHVQFAFVSSADIPMLVSAGMRFGFDFFYMDIGVSYAVEIGTSENPIFEGWYPSVAIGFRF